MSMFSSTPAPITSPGWKARQEAAEAKREANTVSPEVREARAKPLADREAMAEASQAAERQARTRPLECFREAMASVPDDVLAELSRFLANMSAREMADVAGETTNQRLRDRNAVRAAGESVQTQGRRKATLSA